jgi:predicted Zn-ribbon and HTH transcriptional regulator
MQWTTKEIAILKSMRENGEDWPEISVATGHTESSCRTKANTEGIRKHKGKPIDRHIGIVDDGPEMNHRKNGRPIQKPPEMRPCIGCKKMFESWDIKKNQRCPRCKSLSDTNTVYT